MVFFIRYLILIGAGFQLNSMIANNLFVSSSVTQDVHNLLRNGFIENKGQFIVEDETSLSILFKSSAPGLDIYITNKGLSYIYYKKNESEIIDVNSVSSQTQYSCEWSRFDMEINKAFIKKENIICEEEITGNINYYLPQSPEGIFNVKKYNKITIKNIYDKIDWVLYFTPQRIMKYDFIVHPGGDVKKISLEYWGIINELKNNSNRLNIINPLGKLSEGDLFCFEKETNKKINCTYEMNQSESFEKNIRFKISSYDKNKTLVIDPPLTWATFYGAADDDVAYGVKTDNVGNLYVVGLTQSTTFPLLNLTGAYFNNSINGTGVYGGFADGFIVKFNAAGVLQWATYYGGSSGDGCTGIEVNALGDIFVSGLTYSTNFPTQPRAAAYNRISKASSADYDIFLLRFNSLGVRLWSTYFGGNGNDDCYRIKKDGSGNIYITGTTASTNYTPTALAGAYNQAAPGGGPNDGFISKFNSNGGLLWSTYVGGNSNDVFNGLAFDSFGNVYLGGVTFSSNFPTVNPGSGYFQAAIGGVVDGVLLKFSSAGAMLWSTYFGGALGFGDFVFDVATDALNNIYVTGITGASDFPIVTPAGTCVYSKTFDGTNDAFVSLFNQSLNLTWSTYLGGTSAETPVNLLCDATDNVYIMGRTNSTDFPIRTPSGSYSQALYGGGSEDGFLLRFSPAHHLYWSTYYGGSSLDYAAFNTATLSNTGDVFAVFNTQSAVGNTQTWGSAYHSGSNAGAVDFLITKFVPTSIVGIAATTSSKDILCNGQATGEASVNVTSGSPGYTYSWSGISQSTSVVTGLQAGTYTVTISDAACSQLTQVVNITQPPPITVSAPSLTVCTGQSVLLSASASGGVVPYTYNWNSGVGAGNTYSVTPTITTEYNLQVTDSNGCIASLQNPTVTVLPLPIANAGHDTTICEGSSVMLSASGGTSYLWNAAAGLSNTTIFNPVLSPLATTTCVVTVSNGACVSIDQIVVTVVPMPSISAIGSTTITTGNSTVITASGGGSYSWYPSSGLSCINCPQPIANPSVTTTYYLVISNEGGCTAMDSLTIYVDIICSDFFIPNAFSPNADGQNDFFQAYGSCIQEMRLIVYDRWGKEVAQLNDTNDKWDGTFKGINCNTDVYVYYLSAKLSSGEEITKQGNVSLIK